MRNKSMIKNYRNLNLNYQNNNYIGGNNNKI